MDFSLFAHLASFLRYFCEFNSNFYGKKAILIVLDGFNWIHFFKCFNSAFSCFIFILFSENNEVIWNRSLLLKQPRGSFLQSSGALRGRARRRSFLPFCRQVLILFFLFWIKSSFLSFVDNFCPFILLFLFKRTYCSFLQSFISYISHFISKNIKESFLSVWRQVLFLFFVH